MNLKKHNNGDVAILSIKKESWLKRDLKYWQLYVFLLPGVLALLIFHYYPIYGIQIAFKKFIPGLPMSESPWIGFDHFERFFSAPDSWRIIWNTLKISGYDSRHYAPSAPAQCRGTPALRKQYPACTLCRCRENI